MAALVLLTAAVLSAYSSQQLERAVVPFERRRLSAQAEILAQVLARRVQQVRNDIIALRGAPIIEQLVEARTSPDGVSSLGVPEAIVRRDVALTVEALLNARPEYYKLRLIGLADGGRELVRVDRQGVDGRVRIVPDEELQRKGERPFFTATVDLPPGDVHVTAVELNQDGGDIETPYVPVLRAAAPVHTANGEFFGSLISNLDMRPVFALLRSSVVEDGQVYVVNERGDYLVHPDTGLEFGFEFGRPVRIQSRWAELSEVLAAREPAELDLRGDDGGLCFVSVVPVPIEGTSCMFLVQSVPRSIMEAFVKPARRASLTAGLATVVPALALALVLSRSITRPLARMKEAVEAFRQGAAMRVPTEAGGEIGALARAFEGMSTEVENKARALGSAEGLLREANKQLAVRVRELAQSNAELQQFAYVASHDLQTPLRTISGFVQLLQRGYGDKLGEEAKEWIGRSVSGAERMQQLIQGLLEYSRVGSAGQSCGPVDLNEVVRDVRNDLAALAEEAGARIEVEELPVVLGDRRRLGQLLSNLLVNALKYRGETAPEVRVWAERDGAGWRVGVRDNGIGIDPRHHRRVFEIFRRLHTEREYPGTGIGLAVCERIVHGHGGRIWVESAGGAGSTFYFTIPDTKGSEHERPVETAAGGNSAG